MTTPRRYDTSAFPGAPGIPGGVKDASDVPVNSGVVGDNDYLDGGPAIDGQGEAFPGYDGQRWQDWQSGPEINPSTVNDQPGHVSGGIRTSSPDAFPGGGQGV